MIKAWKHLCTILHHKNLVRAGCFKIGLYKQGLLHDMSKYTPTEFLVGCKYYQGTMSPNNAEREDKVDGKDRPVVAGSPSEAVYNFLWPQQAKQGKK